jgi:transcriptional regulator with XRE-family HTH domain
MAEEGMQSPLARKLRMLRAREGITLAEVEERSGVTRESIGELERGKRIPFGSTLQKLAQAYGVTLAELLEEEETALTGPKVEAPRAAGQPDTYEEAAEAFERVHYSPAAIAAGWHRLAQRWDERLEQGDFDAQSLEELIDTLEDLAVGMEANVAEERRELSASYDDPDLARNTAVLPPAIRRLSALVRESLRKIDAEKAEQMSPKVTRLEDRLKRAG